MKKINYYLAFLSSLSILLVACGKDRDAQDYKNDLLSKSLAKLQAVQGSYSGYVISKKDGSNMGAMKVTLTAKTKVTQGSDQSGSTAQAVLAVNVDFQGISKMAVVAQDSYFDSERGHFQTDIPIVLRNSQGQFENKTVTISGVVAGEHLVGELQGFEFPEYGAKIDLNKQNISLEALAKRVPPVNGGFSNGGFIGVTHFARGVTKNVLMVLSKPNTTSEVDFYNLFSPVKPVQITLNYGQDAQINFSNGNWDQRVGKLTGQAKLTQVSEGPNGTSISQSVDISLICEVASGNGFACKVQASNAVGNVAEIQLAPNTDGSEINDDNGNRGPLTKSYKGFFVFGPTDKIPSILAVTYPARTRIEEITNLFFPRTEVNVVVNLNIKEIGLSFSKVKWDITKGTLDTTQPPDGVSARVTLTCQNFYFLDENYSFQCRYHSNGNANGQLIFTSEH